MYALLDFGYLRIEQRTEYSKVKSYYKGKLVDDYEAYCDEKSFENIKNFLQGVIEQDAFRDCTNLTSITIPDSVTSIGYGAFRNCTSLTSVTISDSVTSIGDNAFYGCTNLTSIEIPDSVTSIGKFAFSNCESLKNIKLPDGIISIEYMAFVWCERSKVVTYKENNYTSRKKLKTALTNNGVFVRNSVF